MENGVYLCPDVPVCEIYLISLFVSPVIASSCEDPPSPDNALRILSSTKVNSVVKYKCNKGYKLIGSSYRVCKANGKWSGVPAQCVGEYWVYYN